MIITPTRVKSGKSSAEILVPLVMLEGKRVPYDTIARMKRSWKDIWWFNAHTPVHMSRQQVPVVPLSGAAAISSTKCVHVEFSSFSLDSRRDLRVETHGPSKWVLCEYTIKDSPVANVGEAMYAEAERRYPGGKALCRYIHTFKPI